MANVLRLSNAVPREKWAERISAAWRKQVPSILETGNLLESAKAELKRGEWLKMTKEELPFTRMTAHRLIAIATNDNLRNVTHVLRLPAHWGTLYELTKLTDEQFSKAIENKAIHPKMKRTDVAALRGAELKDGATQKPREQDPATLPGWRRDLQSRITRAAFALESDERRELFDHLRKIMETTERDLTQKEKGE